MKIAYFLRVFPKLSESFILNQIIELQDRGHDVQIFSMREPTEDIVHKEIKAHDLLSRTHYYNFNLKFNKQSIILLIFFIKLLIIDISNLKVSINKLKFNLKLAYFAAIMFTTGIELIHAHFGTIGNQCLQLKKILKKPLITSFYGIDAAVGDTTTYADLFSSNSIVTVLSNDMKKDLLA